jgi:hypothetical protein
MSTLGAGARTHSMAKASISFPVAKSTMAIFLWTRRKELAPTTMTMHQPITLAIGIKIRSRVKEY